MLGGDYYRHNSHFTMEFNNNNNNDNFSAAAAAPLTSDEDLFAGLGEVTDFQELDHPGLLSIPNSPSISLSNRMPKTVNPSDLLLNPIVNQIPTVQQIETQVLAPLIYGNQFPEAPDFKTIDSELQFSEILDGKDLKSDLAEIEKPYSISVHSVVDDNRGNNDDNLSEVLVYWRVVDKQNNPITHLYNITVADLPSTSPFVDYEILLPDSNLFEITKDPEYCHYRLIPKLSLFLGATTINQSGSSIFNRGQYVTYKVLFEYLDNTLSLDFHADLSASLKSELVKLENQHLFFASMPSPDPSFYWRWVSEQQIQNYQQIYDHLLSLGKVGSAILFKSLFDNIETPEFAQNYLFLRRYLGSNFKTLEHIIKLPKLHQKLIEELTTHSFLIHLYLQEVIDYRALLRVYFDRKLQLFRANIVSGPPAIQNLCARIPDFIFWTTARMQFILLRRNFILTGLPFFVKPETLSGTQDMILCQIMDTFTCLGICRKIPDKLVYVFVYSEWCNAVIQDVVKIYSKTYNYPYLVGPNQNSPMSLNVPEDIYQALQQTHILLVHVPGDNIKLNEIKSEAALVIKPGSVIGENAKLAQKGYNIQQDKVSMIIFEHAHRMTSAEAAIVLRNVLSNPVLHPDCITKLQRYGNVPTDNNHQHRNISSTFFPVPKIVVCGDMKACFICDDDNKKLDSFMLALSHHTLPTAILNSTTLINNSPSFTGLVHLYQSCNREEFKNRIIRQLNASKSHFQANKQSAALNAAFKGKKFFVFESLSAVFIAKKNEDIELDEFIRYLPSLSATKCHKTIIPSNMLSKLTLDALYYIMICSRQSVAIRLVGCTTENEVCELIKKMK